MRLKDTAEDLKGMQTHWKLDPLNFYLIYPAGWHNADRARQG